MVAAEMVPRPGVSWMVREVWSILKSGAQVSFATVSGVR